MSIVGDAPNYQVPSKKSASREALRKCAQLEAALAAKYTGTHVMRLQAMIACTMTISVLVEVMNHGADCACAEEMVRGTWAKIRLRREGFSDADDARAHVEEIEDVLAWARATFPKLYPVQETVH